MRNAITRKNIHITHLKHRCTKENPSRIRARNSRALTRALVLGVLATEGGRVPLPPRAPPFLHAAQRPRDAAQSPRKSPALTRWASCLLRAGETPALRRQGDAKRLRNRVITSCRHSLASLARPISRSSGVNDHAAQLRSRSAGLGSPAALSCRVSMFAASRVAVVALRWFGLPPSPAQGCGRWPQRPYGARVRADALRGSLRSPRRFLGDIFGLPSIFCACGAVALALKYRWEPSSDIDSINPFALNNNK